jgi:hypothetical protein
MRSVKQNIAYKGGVLFYIPELGLGFEPKVVGKVFSYILRRAHRNQKVPVGAKHVNTC